MEKKYLVLLLGGAELLAATLVGLAAASPITQTFSQVAYAGGDVVADQPHAFDALDTPVGGFVGVPVFE